MQIEMGAWLSMLLTILKGLWIGQIPPFLYSLYFVDLGPIGPWSFSQYIVKIDVYTFHKVKKHHKITNLISIFIDI